MKKASPDECINNIYTNIVNRNETETLANIEMIHEIKKNNFIGDEVAQNDTEKIFNSDEILQENAEWFFDINQISEEADDNYYTMPKVLIRHDDCMQENMALEVYEWQRAPADNILSEIHDQENLVRIINIIYMADSRSNREVKKWIFLKLSENVLQLILDAPEFFQIF